MIAAPIAVEPQQRSRDTAAGNVVLQLVRGRDSSERQRASRVEITPGAVLAVDTIGKTRQLLAPRKMRRVEFFPQKGWLRNLWELPRDNSEGRTVAGKSRQTSEDMTIE